MKITSKDLVRILRDRARPWLTGGEGSRSKFYNFISEIYPVHASRSDNMRPRFNILLPTAKPEKIYGGIATALKVANEIIISLPENIDIRIIITSDSVNRESISEVSRRLNKTFLVGRPNEDLKGCLVVDLFEYKANPISIRKNDIFFATAWWTAELGFRLAKMQKSMFRRSLDLIYLIQDFEPGFYQWSNRYAISEATYHNEDQTIALMNSQELFDFMTDKYKFKSQYLIPFVVNEEITRALRECKKEKIILVYGRPSVARNCFEVIVEALRLWQFSEPSKNLGYQVIFVGENFSNLLVNELENKCILGKLPLMEYADLLSRSAIGISLMLSPHPSYPPLEMANAGCVTITNNFENKNLALHHNNILSLEKVSPQRLANEIENAVLCFESGSKPIAKIANNSYIFESAYAKEIADKFLTIINNEDV